MHKFVKYLFFCLAVSILTVTSPFAAGASPSAWEGHYADTVDVEQEGQWTYSLRIHDCSGSGCQFEYSGGSEGSACEAQGQFQFKSDILAEQINDFSQISDPSDPRGQCLVTLERLKDGNILVDAHDIFIKPQDQEFGNPCNLLCGWQGARYFGNALKRDTR